MKYQVGDKVILLHSREEGIILEILNQEMARVQVAGVDFPVYLDQVDFPYYYKFSKKFQNEFRNADKTPVSLPELPREKIKTNKETLNGGAQLVFFPIAKTNDTDFLVERFKVYLSNEVSYSLWFSYSYKKKGQVCWNLEGTCQSGVDFYLHDILFEDFSDNPIFNFTIKPISAHTNFKEELITTIRIKPRQLFEQLEKIRLQKLASFSYPIFDYFPEKEYVDPVPTLQLKPPASSSVLVSKSQQDFEDSFSHIVDLHIENLLPDWKGLSNFEILQIQLSHFERIVARTIRNQQPTLIVIHGIGEGKLKSEIHHFLRQIKEVHSFDNRYDPRFGQGATTIQFQY